jgi:uncharacterized protein YjbI with pentapeptide repeats
MTKIKARKIKSSKRSTSGKSSVEKGKTFEDKVADLYRLLGAKVIQNIEICQKKVDIFAAFPVPGSPLGHRVIVECKDEKKHENQNQRVMQFKGLLDTARKSGEADSAEIITTVPWSDQAKGFARDSGVVLLTYLEKISQLIDFKTYLKTMIDRFEKGDPFRPDESPLGAYYVQLAGKRLTGKEEEIPSIENYIYQWLKDKKDRKHLAILGEYGTGKTSLCQKLLCELAKSYLEEPGSTRIPVLFNLRHFTKTLKIESLVTSFLDEECEVINPKFKLFKAMNDAGILFLIFDGFDEMAVRVDSDTLEINLQEIEKLASSPNSKAMITSRIEYFKSWKEQESSFFPKRQLLSTRNVEYETLKIEPWNDEQVKTFLKRRVPLIKGEKETWEYYCDRIREISGLSDLSRRPVLLEMIVKTLPQLIAMGKTINRPNLYDTYLRGEIKRQKITKQRTLLLTEDARYDLLKRLSLDFFEEKGLSIIFPDALKFVEKFVKPPRSELEAYTRDFLSCSFLSREGDEFRFSHKSFSEYLIAVGLAEEIRENEPKFFKSQILQSEITDFLIELDPNKDVLWNWMLSTRNEDIDSVKYLGGNSATLLCKLDRNALAGKDISGAILNGANLSFSNLLDTNLFGTLLKNSDLRGAKFLKKSIAQAKISGIEVSLFIIFKTDRDIPELIKNHLNVSPYMTAVLTLKDIKYTMTLFCLEEIKFLKRIEELHSSINEIHTMSFYADEYKDIHSLIPKYFWNDFVFKEDFKYLIDF